MIVRHEDTRCLRYCNRGAREFFERHGLNWRQFVTEGVPAHVLLALGDAMADAAVAQARRRLRGE